MLDIFFYINEKNETSKVIFDNQHQNKLEGHTIGVKWQTPNNKIVQISKKNKKAILCPLINKKLVLISFVSNAMADFRFMDNPIYIYDFEGEKIKEINRLSQNNERLINNHKFDSQCGRVVTIKQEYIDNKKLVCCYIYYPIANFWRELYEKFLFDEEYLELNKVIETYESD